MRNVIVLPFEISVPEGWEYELSTDEGKRPRLELHGPAADWVRRSDRDRDVTTLHKDLDARTEEKANVLRELAQVREQYATYRECVGASQGTLAESEAKLQAQIDELKTKLEKFRQRHITAAIDRGAMRQELATVRDHRDRLATEVRELAQYRPRPCMASFNSDPPQDCDAPHCGCNPAWEQAAEWLQEEGWGPLGVVNDKLLRIRDAVQDVWDGNGVGATWTRFWDLMEQIFPEIKKERSGP